MAFIVDSSVSMAWCFADETSSYTDQILERLQFEEAWVPAIWPFEVINVLLVAERRKRLTGTQAEAFLETLTELPIRVQNIDWPGKIPSLLTRGRSFGLTAYDCAYIDLALRMGYPLSTQDTKIREVAIHLDIELL